jgi:hypothetical protein
VITSRINAAADTRPAASVIGPNPVRASSTPRKLAPQITPSVIRISQFITMPEEEVFDVMPAKLFLPKVKIKGN